MPGLLCGGIHKVISELEAKLSGVGKRFAKATGKLERKTYGDSTERLKIQVKGLDSAEVANATVVINSREVAQFPLHNGRGKFDLESPPGTVPELSLGQDIQVFSGSELVLEGKLVED